MSDRPATLREFFDAIDAPRLVYDFKLILLPDRVPEVHLRYYPTNDVGQPIVGDASAKFLMYFADCRLVPRELIDAGLSAKVAQYWVRRGGAIDVSPTTEG